MSDIELGKKLVEEVDLNQFIEAYEWVTGDLLTLLSWSESPDFICARSNGKKVGVEITNLMRDPERAFYETIIEKKEYIPVYDFYDMAYCLASKKSEKKKKNKWTYSKNTILVIQSDECPLEEINSYIDISLQSDFSSFGFKEIWLADFTEIDAYGDIELFGLHPKKWWGYHCRQNPHRKPYDFYFKRKFDC
jgi:hypothetical protein